MSGYLEFAEGPLFRFAIALLILGLAHQLLLAVVGFLKGKRHAGTRPIRYGALLRATGRQLNPLRYLTRPRGGYTFLTLTMHVGLIVVPVLLAGHIYLLAGFLGFGWWHLPVGVADVLTLITLVAVTLVLVERLANDTSRRISRVQDWALPILIAVIFGSGYLMAHPGLDVLPYPGMRLVHVLAADVLLIAIPFTKIAHMVLLPFSQLAGELGWRFVPGAGDKVRKTLGKEGQGA